MLGAKQCLWILDPYPDPAFNVKNTVPDSRKVLCPDPSATLIAVLKITYNKLQSDNVFNRILNT
jgi:hypothetical protein